MFSGPLSLDCRINRSHLKAGRKAVVFVSADVQTKELKELAETVGPSSLNVCLAIDCSGSMGVGDKLETAKKAAMQLVDSLSPDDQISIVRFASTASVVIPRQRAENKSEIKNRIRRMKLGSATAMYDGMKKAHKELVGDGIDAATALIPASGIVEGFKKLLGRKPVNASKVEPSAPAKELGVRRMILLTDGNPTTGPVDESSFVDLSKTIRESGISVTTLGIGEDYNEDLLTAVAATSGGKWYHITDLARLPEIFREELKDATTVMLIRPELRVQLLSGAEISNIYRVGTMFTEMTERDFKREGNNYILPLEDVRAGEMYRMVFNVHVPPKPLGTWRIAKITLVAPQFELAKDVVVESTENPSLWSVESDPYPRTALMIFQATVLARKGVDDPTFLKQSEEIIDAIHSDPSAKTVLIGNRFFNSAVDTVVRVNQETAVLDKKMTKQDKKELKGKATIVRK